MEVVASEKRTTASRIEESMTLSQIELAYFFYMREEHRRADRIACATIGRLSQAMKGE